MPDAITPQGATPVAPLMGDALAAWRRRLTGGRDVSKDLVREGRKSLQRVTAKTLPSKPSQHTVVVPLDYASVEQKKAQLFQVPEMIAEGRTPEAEPMAPLFAAITNFQLGPEGVNAGAMMFEAQADVLIQGYAVTKIGYENVVDGVEQVATGAMQPDPNAVPQPGAVLGLGAQPPMVPVTQPVPRIISETYYWRRIPPGFLLAPPDFKGSNFDDAAWLAWRFSEDLLESERGAGSSTKDDELLLTEPSTAAKSQKRFGTEVWYKASLFDEDVKHPDVIRTFTIYDDEAREPVARRDSPFQRWVMPTPPTPAQPPPVAGQPPAPVQPKPPAALMPSYQPGAALIGMKGFPLHILTLRYVPDRAFPMSDVQMGGSLSDEISVGRTQVLRRRDRSLPQVLYDATRVPGETMTKIERNENTGFIGVPGNPSEMFLPLDKGQFGRENFAFNDQAQQDYDKTWAHGDNGGTVRGAGETATKTNQIQNSIETRLQAERGRELEWFVAGATKLMSLYQIFADQTSYAPLVGQTGATTLQAWDKTLIPGPFVLKPRPNSHIRLSPEQDFQQELQFFNLAGNAPEGNRFYMLQRLASKRGLDPNRAVQEPPPKGPDAAKGSISFKVEDFIGPGGPVAAELAAQCGFKVSPEAMQQANTMLAIVQAQQAQMDALAAQNTETEHGGAMEHGGLTNPINKHAQERTGGVPGMGVQ